MNAEVTDDGRYAVLQVWLGTIDGTGSLPRPQGSKRPKVTGEVVRLLDDFDASYSFVGNDGPVFYFLTDLDAPRKRVIAIDTRTPSAPVGARSSRRARTCSKGSSHPRQFVASTCTMPRRGCACSRSTDDREGARAPDARLDRWHQRGAEGRRDVLRLHVVPVPHHDLPLRFQDGCVELFKAPTIDFDPSSYGPSRSSTQARTAPVCRCSSRTRGVAARRLEPDLLYGYGGFNISSRRPSPWRCSRARDGRRVRPPEPPGGGEYGEEWHQAGMHDKKQNVFDDFIRRRRVLDRQGYTSTPKLAIAGGSNGGLLVELRSRSDPTIRGRRFRRRRGWTCYGFTSSRSLGVGDGLRVCRQRGAVPYLYKYSPLHNIRRHRYPPRSSRPRSRRPRRAGAFLQVHGGAPGAQAGPQPVLIEIETKRGTARQADQQAHRGASGSVRVSGSESRDERAVAGASQPSLRAAGGRSRCAESRLCLRRSHRSSHPASSARLGSLSCSRTAMQLDGLVVARMAARRRTARHGRLLLERPAVLLQHAE